MTNEARSSLLVASPPKFSHWWVFMPVLPAQPDTHEYKVLKRQWADHTMNTKDGTRGVYVATTEDHITTCLFQIWAAFPGCDWVSALLDLWRVPHEKITNVRWSYSWAQKPYASKGYYHHADIVVNWTDAQGPGILIIEAKRPGGTLKEKERDGGARYLDLPSIRPYARRYVGFLIAERDRRKAARILPSDARVSTWEDMGRAQVKCAAALPISPELARSMQSYIARHYATLGLGFDPKLVSRSDGEDFSGTADRYAKIRAFGLPGSVERFFLGSEATFCARGGVMPAPPLEYFARELSLLEVVKTIQPTPDRTAPLWRIE